MPEPAARRPPSALGLPRVDDDPGGSPIGRPRAGMVTGVLLAVARISGETAPLLFTALNNQFWSTNLERADGEPAGRRSSSSRSALCGLAEARLDRRADHHRRRAGAQHHGARRPRRGGVNSMNVAAVDTSDRQAASPLDTAAAARRSRSRNLDFFYGESQRAEGHQPAALREQGHRLHRPVGLRQVDAAARPQPDVRPLSGPARRGRGAVRRRATSSTPRPGPQPAALADRHGVPEADAVPDVDLREHRLRHPPLREAVASARLDEPRRDSALRRAALWTR